MALIDQQKIEVVLVCMPYVDLARPSLALGLLKAGLERKGINASVIYPNLWFAEKVGARLHYLCCQRTFTEFLCGEWTFAQAAFPDADRSGDSDYLRLVGNAHGFVGGYSKKGDGERLQADLKYLQESATEFIEEAAERVFDIGARIVGCTSSFEQHTASLALLRCLKRLDPKIVTMMGGANCETVMGQTTHESFPWIDFVVSGEADNLIGDLCHQILNQGPLVAKDEVPEGVLTPSHRSTVANLDAKEGTASLKVLGQAKQPPRVLCENLDDLPTPDYDDYFSELNSSSLRSGIRPGVPIETSRGCWWGASRHCTFCGLNGGGMKYRSKSPERVLEEMTDLENRYGISDFETVDNILDMNYFKTVLPQLAAVGGRRRIFYETKANLKYHQIELMKDAGIVWFQPGIESFHSSVLKLIDKGVQGWQNIQLLRWSRECGLRVFWSILWGFPGEDDKWYSEMATWMPFLEHLQPPAGIFRLRYDRYSVYQQASERFGLELECIPAMSYIYPLPVEDLLNLTYFFIDPNRADPFSGDYFEERLGLGAVRRQFSAWQQVFRQENTPTFSVQEYENKLIFHDTRRIAKEHQTVLSGLACEIYRLCEKAPNQERIALILERRGINASKEEVRVELEHLVARGFVLLMDSRLVALAVRGEPPKLPGPSEFPGGYIDLRLLDREHRLKSAQ